MYSSSFLATWMAATARAHAERSEIETLFRDLGAMPAGTPDGFDRADPVLQQLVQSSRGKVAAAFRHMGTSDVLDNQEFLSRIAAETTRPPSVRAAAEKALLSVP